MKTRRKTTPTQLGRKPGARELRQAGDLIQGKKLADGLSLLNEFSKTASPLLQRRALALVADTSIRRGDPLQAASIFKKLRRAETDPANWLRVSIGEVRAFLNAADFVEAESSALEVVHAARERELADKKIRAGLISTPASNVTVAPRPPRASVVATRLAAQFLQAGNPSVARTLLDQAIAWEPKGGTKARIKLAQMAWSARDYPAAQKWAEDALQVGANRAKTVSAWPLLLRALSAQQLPPPSWPSIDSLLTGVKPNIRARTVHKIVRTLRSTNQSEWKTIALGWWNSASKREPRVAADIAKILLADARLTHAAAPDLITAAQRVLGVPKITFNEWWSATRELLVAQKKSLLPLDFDQHYQAGLAVCRPTQLAWMRHSFAKTLWQLGEKSRGLRLLRENTAPLAPGNPLYVPGNFTLARLELSGGHPRRAASIYLHLFNEFRLSKGQRFSALLRWTSLPQDLPPDQAETVRTKAVELVHDTRDYRSVFTMALACIGRPGVLRGVGSISMTHGETLALAAIAAAQTPTQATIPLFHLSRRRYDYGLQSKVAIQWLDFSPDYRAWLQNDLVEFWDYLGYVFRCLWLDERTTEAAALAVHYTRDPSSLPAGAAQLASLYALRLIDTGSVAQAYRYFEQAGTQGEGNPVIAYAHYWLGLRSYRRGDPVACRQSLKLCRQVLGSAPVVAWHKALYARSLAAETLIDSSSLQGLTPAMLESIEQELPTLRENLATLGDYIAAL